MPEESNKNTESTMNSKGEKDALFDLKYMTKADVEGYVDAMANKAKAAIQLYPSIIQGFKYDEMNNALTQVLSDITGGPHKELARRHPWIKTDARKLQNFLNPDSEEVTVEDREAVVGLYKVGAKTGEVMTKVNQYLGFAQTAMEDVTAFFCFHRYMQATFKDDDYRELIEIFDDYELFAREYMSADIYNGITLNVKKSNTYEENYKVVTDYMDKWMKERPGVMKLFDNHSQLKAEKMNEFRVIDILTGAFKDFESVGATAATMVNDCDQIKAQLSTLIGQPELSVGYNYFWALRDLIEKIGFMFVEMDNAIKDYKKGESAPYCMMKYHFRVKDVASTQLFESLSDPCYSGTEYYKLGKKMAARNKELAQLVAKNAAKWAKD